MFVGHFAVAFAAKRAEPRLPLVLLFVAVDFCDILWPILILAGVEHARIVPGVTAASPLDLYDYPWSHSLVLTLLWSALFAAPFLVRKQPRAASVVAACVFSHFVLDVVTHRPDVPIAPGMGARLGLGLWNSIPASIAVEAALYGAGVWVYIRGTESKGKMGTIGLGLLVVLLAAAWLSGIFGPPPPGMTAVAATALPAVAVTAVWAHLIDRSRPPARGRSFREETSPRRP